MYALLNDAIQHVRFKHHPQTLTLDSGTIQQSAPQYYLSTTSGTASPGTTDNISLRTAPNRAGTPLTWESISVFSGGKKV